MKYNPNVCNAHKIKEAFVTIDLFCVIFEQLFMFKVLYQVYLINKHIRLTNKKLLMQIK